MDESYAEKFADYLCNHFYEECKNIGVKKF